MLSTNSGKLIFVAVLLGLLSALAVFMHRRSGESVLRVRQHRRYNAAFEEVLAVVGLLVFLGLLLPAFGRTGPAWRRPPWLVEFALHLPLIVGVALGAGWAVSLVRRVGRDIRHSLRSRFGA